MTHMNMAAPSLVPTAAFTDSLAIGAELLVGDVGRAASEPAGTVIITFHIYQHSPLPEASRTSVLKCRASGSYIIPEDANKFSHTVISKALTSPDVWRRVLDATISDFQWDEAELEYDKDAARAMEYDFACFLTETESRKPTSTNDALTAAVTADVVLSDGSHTAVSLPPTHLTFRSQDSGPEPANHHSGENSIAIDSAVSPLTKGAVPTAPFPMKSGKPTGRLPHFYHISTQDGLSRNIRDLTLEQLWPVAHAAYMKAPSSTTPDVMLALACACNAELIQSFPSAPMAIKLRACHNLMQLATLYRHITSQSTEVVESPLGSATARPMKFNDWYIACCLCTGLWFGIGAISSVVERTRLQEEYFPVALEMAVRHYKLCEQIYRCPDTDFDDHRALGMLQATFRFCSAITMSAEYHMVRYAVTQNVDDLDEVVRLYREALRLPSLGPWYDQYLLEKLAESLSERFGVVQDDADLDDMLEASRECASYARAEGEASASAYFTIARVLTHRGLRHNSAEDATEAVAFLRLAAQISPNGRHIQIQLADSLLLRATILSSSEGVDEAVEIGQALLRDAVETDANYATLVNFAATCHYRRFRVAESPDPQDATAALQYLERARSLDLHDDTRAGCLHARAMLLHLPHAPTRDVTASLTYLKEAMNIDAASPSQRLLYLNDWLKVPTVFAALDAEAARLYLDVTVVAIRLLPLIADLKLDAHHRLRALRRMPNYTSAAVTLAVTHGMPNLALELVEEGRFVFWNQALRLRSRLDDVPQDLRDAFLECTRQLEEDGATGPAPLTAVVRGGHDDRNVRRRRCVRELAAVTTQIRALPGLGRFLLPQTPEVLRSIGNMGPVVVLTSASDMDNCTAMIIHNRSVSHAVLKIRKKQLRQLWADWHCLAQRTRRGGQEDRGGVEEIPEGEADDEGEVDDLPLGALSLRSRPEQPDESHRAVRFKKNDATSYVAILKALYMTVVDPVLRHIGVKRRTQEKRKRIWWCPTGPFAFLPLHAAGIYEDGGECCSDYCVSSYTPSLQALLNARANARPLLKADAKILLAAAPRPYQGAPIPVSVQEVRAIANIVSRDQMLHLPPEDDVLQDAQSGLTVQTALDRLPHASIFHLASHGQQLAERPLESGFLLRDAKLKISDLMRRPLPHAFLAFLSACETARGLETYPEESLHLASAVLFAGFKSVVATMWSMDDVDGPEVAKAVYQKLFAGADGYLDADVIPYALDEAVRALRDGGASPGRWATYVHFGV